MKIGPIDIANATAASPGADRAARRTQGKADPRPASEPGVRVDLSASASLRGEGVEGSFDQAKVDRIAQAIRDGRFEVNAEAIADKLIANARELLGKSTG